MERSELKSLKTLTGRRLVTFTFAPLKKKLPKPLDKLSGSRIKTTPLYDVGTEMKAIFVWKTGLVREQRSLFGWLFRESDRGLEPLFRLDYHPSHKNLHAKINCEGRFDLINRDLVGCKEFGLRDVDLDPDIEADRSKFISIFCERFNIQLGDGDLI